MRFEILILFAGATGLFASELDLGPRLDRVAEVTTAMVEGDVCLKIQTPRSLQYSAMKDPRDPWRAGDNYDVDHAAFFQTKKTLTRLQHLCGTPCAANLWMRVPSMPGRVQIVVRNALELSQYAFGRHPETLGGLNISCPDDDSCQLIPSWSPVSPLR